MNVREWLVIPLAVGLIAWAGFALRAWNLDAQSLWWDEGFSLNLAGQSVGTIIRGDFHPPLYHLLLAGWTRVAGTTDFAARYLSVTCGTLLIPLAFSVGKRLFSRATGLVAALLTAGSPVLLWYTQETRMYILVALAYLPWLPIFFSLEGRYNPIAATPPTLRTFVDQVWHGYNAGSLALVGHHAVFMRLSTLAGILCAIAPLIALFRDPRRSKILWLLGHTLVPLAAIFGLMQLRPFFHPRYVVMLAAPLLVIVARVGTNIQYPISNHRILGTRYWVLLVPFVFLLAFGIAIHAFTTDARYQRDDLRGLAQHLAGVAGPNDAVVFGYLDYAFRRYYAGSAPATYLDLSRPDHAVAQTLAADLAGRNQAFLVTWNQAPVDRRGLLSWLLASAGRLVEERPWGDLTIHTYALDRAVPPPSLVSQTADFGLLRLMGAAVPASAPAAGAIPIAVQWAAPIAPPLDYKIALRLRDEAGHASAQADHPLVNRAGEATANWAAGTDVTNYATLRLPRGTPPGEYTVDLVVYDAATLRRLDRQDVAGQHVALGTVRLTSSDAPFLAAMLPGFTPGEGRRPTTGWLAEEIIVDQHPMTWKEAGFTGLAQIEIGLYDPQTGDRVRTATGADHVILPTTVEVTE